MVSTSRGLFFSTKPMTSQILKLPRFNLFSFIKGLALGIHLRILERRRNRIKLLPAAVEPAQLKLSPTEIESLKIAEQITVPPVLPALIGQPILPELVLPQLQPQPNAPVEALPIQEVIGQPEIVLQDIQDMSDIQDTADPLPEADRATVVLQLLDEAHGRGCRTYIQLIDYVKEQTGTGCSKRTIAAWKKQRGLAA